MVPVAYDNADATAKPQLPNTLKLVLASVYDGLVQAALSLLFIFLMAEETTYLTTLQECTNEAQGFIFMQLDLVTEFAIFSVRTPSYFWKSVPSTMLIVFVILTCIYYL
jgi:hypothetical protein